MDKNYITQAFYWLVVGAFLIFIFLSSLFFDSTAQAIGGAQQESCHTFASNLVIGNEGEETAYLQEFLIREGFNEIRRLERGVNVASAVFGEATASAVVGFQEKYASEVLLPRKFARGSGYVGELTRAKLNQLYGCTVPGYTLSVVKAGTGSGSMMSSPTLGINCGDDCIETYTTSPTITLYAQPDNGSTFTAWSGCSTANGATCVVFMNTNRDVTATFTQPPAPPVLPNKYPAINDILKSFLGDLNIECPNGTGNFYGRCVKFLKLFGQRSVGETIQYQTTAHSFFHNPGVAIDRSVKPNRVYALDSGNNRILGWKSIGACNNNASMACTNNTDCSAGAQCVIGPLKDADMVFGQPDAQGSACNQDNNLGSLAKPTAGTLCLTYYPQGTNVAEQWQHGNIDVDQFGNLYVIDTYNNRALKYNQPFNAGVSGGKGDALADMAWGQDNLESNGINKGREWDVDASSLYTSFEPPDHFGLPDHVASRGVSVDAQGNIWVADTFNNRVLRFLPTSANANLVIGRGSGGFTGRGMEACYEGAQLNKVCAPTLARIHPSTGELYVIDEYPRGFRARILVFRPPFTSGMSAYKVIKPNDSTIPGYWFTASTLAFNKFKNGDCAAGELWVNEHGGGYGVGARTLLLDRDGNIIKRFATDASWPSGSLGFDDAGNMYIADQGGLGSGIERYTLAADGSTCSLTSRTHLFNHNEVTANKFAEPVGMVPFSNQLVVKDHGRLLVWSDYLRKNSFGSLADKIIDTSFVWGSRTLHAIDDLRRLWESTVVFQLPFQNNSDVPIAKFLPLYWADNSSPIESFEGMSVAFDPLSKYLWVNDSKNSRVLRVRNYKTPQDGKLYVDMVIGQPDKDHTKCNQTQQAGWVAPGAPTANGLCGNSYIRFDKLGNLYVVENSYECHGNNRISVFMAEDIRKADGTLFPNISARKVFARSSLTELVSCEKLPNEPSRPVALAFNGKNQMVAGSDGYYPDSFSYERAWKQLYFYDNPLAKDRFGEYVQGQKPDAYIRLPVGAPGELWFDDDDNLIVQDHTWSKVWVIDLKEKDSLGKYVWLVPLGTEGPW